METTACKKKTDFTLRSSCLKRMSVDKSNYSFTLVRFQQKRKITDVPIVRERQTRRELWMIPVARRGRETALMIES